MSFKSQLFTALPLDITLLIIPFFTPYEIVALRLVNRAHHAIFTSEPVCKVAVHVCFGREPPTVSQQEEGDINFRRLFDTLCVRRERFRRGRPTRLSTIQAGSPIHPLPYVSRFNPGHTVLVAVQNDSILEIYQLDRHNVMGGSSEPDVLSKQRDQDVSGTDVSDADVRRIDIGREVEQHPGLRTTPGKRMQIGMVVAGQDGKLLVMLLNVAAVGDENDEYANQDGHSPAGLHASDKRKNKINTNQDDAQLLEEYQEIMLAVIDIDVPSTSTSDAPHLNRNSSSSICQVWPWTRTNLYPFHYAPRLGHGTFVLPAAINQHFAVYVYHAPSREYHIHVDPNSDFYEYQKFALDPNDPGLHLAIMPVLGPPGQLAVPPVLGKSALYLLADPEFAKSGADQGDIAVDRAGVLFFHAIHRRKVLHWRTLQGTNQHVISRMPTIWIDVYKVQYGTSTPVLENVQADQIVIGVEKIATVALDGNWVRDVGYWPAVIIPVGGDQPLNPSFHAPQHLNLPESKHHLTLTEVFTVNPSKRYSKTKAIAASYTFPTTEAALRDLLGRRRDDRYGLLNGDEVQDFAPGRSPGSLLTSDYLSADGTCITGSSVCLLTPDLLWYATNAKLRGGAPLAPELPATHLADYVCLPPVLGFLSSKWPTYGTPCLDIIEIPLFHRSRFRYFADKPREQNMWSLRMKPNWSVQVRLQRRGRSCDSNDEIQNRQGKRGEKDNNSGAQLEVPITMRGLLFVLAVGDGWVLCRTSHSQLFVVRFD
ncbi:hypothetical protein BDZ91DRAFT_845262 [Kalaharituber pfeilii]|nr:hypothetical protein BDZ91DRAFT_845262 [Kalaharituber pfeilii]